MTINRLQGICYTLIILIASGYLLQIGSTIIIPIIFAILISVFLNPLDNKIRSVVKLKGLSIVLSFLCLILPLVLIATLFSFQLMNIMDSLPSISEGISDGYNKLIQKVNNFIPFLNLSADSIIEKGEESDLSGPLKLVGQGLVSTTTVIGSAGLVLIYSFLFMYYKNSFKRFIIYTFDKENRPGVKESLVEIKETIQAYIGGLGLVIFILAILNSIGLSIIGIEHAIFWGTLAGLLAIIPFVGTLLGGMLPFIFALSTAEASWQPYAVIVYYLFIQQLEGNFITPKIVGGKVDINPLFAILSLVFFGSFWGIAGVILALPIISILKIVLSQFDKTEALSVLMSSDLSSTQGVFRKIASSK